MALSEDGTHVVHVDPLERARLLSLSVQELELLKKSLRTRFEELSQVLVDELGAKDVFLQEKVERASAGRKGLECMITLYIYICICKL